MVVQVGVGVLFIHALPPYSSWESFSPEVGKVIEILLAQMGPTHGFSAASLRYLDAFGDRFLDGAAPAEFASEVLGYRIDFPEAVQSERNKEVPAHIAVNYGFVTTEGLQAQISLSEGVVNNQPSLITDTVVSAVSTVEGSAEAVMQHFEDAHSVIHNIFIGSTKSITQMMGPVGVDE